MGWAASSPATRRTTTTRSAQAIRGSRSTARKPPDEVIRGFGVEEFDHEGRYIEARWGDLAVVSLYLPSGSAGPHRQESKFRFLDAFLPHLRTLKRSKPALRSSAATGTSRTRQIDLKNWRSNQKNSGFLPEERAWLDTLFDEVGYVDAFREVNTEPEQYTWWSNRGQAWAKNVGWRIDYQIVSPALAGTAPLGLDLQGTSVSPITRR